MANLEKNEVVAMPIMIGTRRNDEKDFRKFLENLYSIWLFGPKLYRYHSSEDEAPFSTLKRVHDDLTGFLDRSTQPVVVFPIMTWNICKETEKVLELMNCAGRIERKNVFVYPIIWDSYLPPAYFRGGHKDYFLFDQGQAFHIYYDPDAISPAAARLAEFTRRIMGKDLATELFPAYFPHEAGRISVHINHEDFNIDNPRRISVPKYPINNDRLYFPVIEIAMKCPYCDYSRTFGRHNLDTNGGIWFQCYNFKCNRETYFKNASGWFDPWPEYDQMRTGQKNHKGAT